MPRYQDPAIPRVNLQPSARPVDTFEAPQVQKPVEAITNDWLQAAQGLAALSPSLSSLMQGVEEERRKGITEQVKGDVLRFAPDDLKRVQALSKDEAATWLKTKGDELGVTLHNADRPDYILQFQFLAGRRWLAGEEYLGQLNALADKAANPEWEGNLEEEIAQVREQILAKLDPQANGMFRQGVVSAAVPFENQFRQRMGELRRHNRQAFHKEQTTTEVAQAMTVSWLNPGDPRGRKAVEELMTGFRETGGETPNEVMLDATERFLRSVHDTEGMDGVAAALTWLEGASFQKGRKFAAQGSANYARLQELEEELERRDAANRRNQAIGVTEIDRVVGDRLYERVPAGSLTGNDLEGLYGQMEKHRAEVEQWYVEAGFPAEFAGNALRQHADELYSLSRATSDDADTVTSLNEARAQGDVGFVRSALRDSGGTLTPQTYQHFNAWVESDEAKEARELDKPGALARATDAVIPLGERNLYTEEDWLLIEEVRAQAALEFSRLWDENPEHRARLVVEGPLHIRKLLGDRKFRGRTIGDLSDLRLTKRPEIMWSDPTVKAVVVPFIQQHVGAFVDVTVNEEGEFGVAQVEGVSPEQLGIQMDVIAQAERAFIKEIGNLLENRPELQGKSVKEQRALLPILLRERAAGVMEALTDPGSSVGAAAQVTSQEVISRSKKRDPGAWSATALGFPEAQSRAGRAMGRTGLHAGDYFSTLDAARQGDVWAFQRALTAASGPSEAHYGTGLFTTERPPIQDVIGMLSMKVHGVPVDIFDPDRSTWHPDAAWTLYRNLSDNVSRTRINLGGALYMRGLTLEEIKDGRTAEGVSLRSLYGDKLEKIDLKAMPLFRSPDEFADARNEFTRAEDKGQTKIGELMIALGMSPNSEEEAKTFYGWQEMLQLARRGVDTTHLYARYHDRDRFTQGESNMFTKAALDIEAAREAGKPRWWDAWKNN